MVKELVESEEIEEVGVRSAHGSLKPASCRLGLGEGRKRGAPVLHHPPRLSPLKVVLKLAATLRNVNTAKTGSAKDVRCVHFQVVPHPLRTVQKRHVQLCISRYPVHEVLGVKHLVRGYCRSAPCPSFYAYAFVVDKSEIDPGTSSRVQVKAHCALTCS